MSQEKELVIEIDKNGEVHIEALGFKGKGCSIAVDEITKALGTVKKKTIKPEFYQEEKVKVKQGR